MIDHIVGAESDSGYRLAVACPACGAIHHVALSRRDGRFIVTCGDTGLAGKVQNWLAYRDKSITKDSTTCQTA